MTMKLITAGRVYRAALPPADALAQHLKSLPFVDLQPSIPFGAGFVAVEPSDEMVHTFPGGYAFALRYDEKILPSSVVKSELKKWAVDFEEQNGYKPGRKAMREHKEMVLIPSLLARALTRTKVIRCFYHPASTTLIVPAASQKIADLVTGCLLRAIESIKTTTIHVAGAKGSLTSRLIGHLDDSDNTFDPLELGAKVKLQDGEGRKFAFDLDMIENAEAGIREAAESGAQVAEVALSYGGVSFRITHDFVLKGIKFEDGAIEYEQDADPIYTFDQEAGAQLAMVCNVIDALCDLFGYKAPEEAEGLL